MSNIFRKVALEEKKKGDNTTSSHVRIFRLPTKILLTASVVSAIAGTIWAATAKIPIDYPGRAVVLDIDTWQDVVSGGNGRIVIIEKEELKGYERELEIVWAVSNDPNMQLKSQKIRELSKKLLDLTSFQNYERFLRNLSTREALKRSATKKIETKIGIPMAIIFSDDARSRFVENLRKNFGDLNDAEAELIRSKNLTRSYKTMLKNQSKVVSIYRHLLAKNYVSKPDYIQQESLYTQYESQIAQSMADIDQAENKKKIALKSMMIAMQTYINRALVLSEADGYIANIKFGQGSIVREGDEVITIGKKKGIKELPTNIAGLIGSTAVNFAEPGDKVIATPVGVNKAEYGGMVGKVKTIVPYGEDVQSLSSILGISTLVSQTKSAGETSAPNLVIITMEKDEQNKTYKWSSNNRPDRKTRLGDVLNISLTTDRKTPVQLAIPFIRTIIGIDGPTTLKDNNGES